MTGYELYINDVLCDLPQDEEISLVYQSGIFQELDVIQSNRSYNINLPLTPRNTGAIEHAQRVDAESKTPYVKMRASLYKGGVPIFASGHAVITEISDTIGIVLTWGNVDNFEPLFDSEMRDLAPILHEMGYGSIPWNESSRIVTGPSGSSSPASMGFFGIDFGQGLNNPKYLHPSIMVHRVLEAIEKQHNITINGIGRLSPTYLLPCVSKNGDEVSGKAEQARFPIRISKDENHILLAANSSPIEGLVNDDGVLFNIKGAKVVDIYIKTHFETTVDRFDPVFKICADNTNTPIATIQTKKVYIMASLIEVEIDFKIQLTVENGQIPKDTNNLIFYLYNGNRSFTQYYSENFIEITAYPREEVHFPSQYPIGVNLPDMSQGDFLTSLLVLNGLFPFADKDTPDTIKLMSADDLFDNLNKGVYVDWSRKILLNESRKVDMPDASQFLIGDYAQNNTLDYENDDEIDKDTHGEIRIENVNLEKENELASLPFSATNNTSLQIGTGEDAYSISIASIPMYESNDKNSNKVEYREPSPRILDYKVAASPDEASRWCYGVFTSAQRFGGSNGIVTNKYASLQRILQKYRMITIHAKLSVLDLYNLKYEVPVFIAQFGAYFAIYSIETGANGICECNLIKLNL